MLKKLSEEDFAVLRGPFESGRQSPEILGRALFLFIFLQALLFFLSYVVAADSTYYPNKEKMFSVHFWITLIVAVASLFYAIPAVYKRSQKVQYLLVTIVTQNAGVSFYIMALFFIFSSRTGMDEASSLTFTYVTLSFGALIFIATCIRFFILLHKGHYRKGSKKDQLRGSIEGNIKSYLPMIIIASTGLVFVLQYLFRTIGFSDVEIILILVLGILLFYAMLFVLPEQLVILYCKFRFKSFNFDMDGNLLTEDHMEDEETGEGASL
ncbi:hypothetical protein [Numidum massiliense]|uniref:hypothetical protein n=1 Tax=Numidum massiliense TaxID=1522315 RepID=UPI0006D56438|nr:hypothetical protein [Numidum massiliense]